MTPSRLTPWLAPIALLVLSPSPARAEDVAYSADKLHHEDFRVRTQAALALGKSDNDAAVQPLCGALDDDNEAVRGAAAAALGKLGRSGGTDCLNTRLGKESNDGVKTQLKKAIDKIAAASGGNIPANAKVYVSIAKITNKSSRSSDEVGDVVSSAMTSKLGTMSGYAVAPRGQSESAAKGIITSKKLKGIQLQTTVNAPVYDGDKLTVTIDVVLVTYPGKDIKGRVSPKLTQSGTSPDDKDSEYALIKMAVERALDNFDRIVATLLFALSGRPHVRFGPREKARSRGHRMAPPTTPVQATGRHQRSVKNYILDPQFQLKYTGFLVVIALVLSGALGALLWRISGEVIEQSRASVTQGLETVRRGKDLVKESQKVSAVVRMNIAKEYEDQPELLKIFNENATKEEQRLEDEQKRLENDSVQLAQQAQALEKQQRTIMLTLIGALSALVVFVAFAGIVITHRVAGPIFKMKRQIRELGEGKLRMPGKLRKGDELVHFFEQFEDTVKNLRAHQAAEIEKLDRAIAALEKTGGDEVSLAPLRGLRAEMQSALE